VLLTSGVAASFVVGVQSAGASEGNDGGHETDHGIPPSNLETCAPDFGGTKVPYSVQGFFGEVSMTGSNVVRPGQHLQLQFRLIATDANCVISNPAAVSAVVFNPTTPPSSPVTGFGKTDDDHVVRFDRKRQIFINNYTVPNVPAGSYVLSQTFYSQTYFASITTGVVIKGR
jgi:hypothetical protein